MNMNTCVRAEELLVSEEGIFFSETEYYTLLKR